MARYYEVNLFFLEEPTRFYRRFLIRSDINLEEFGCVITTFLNTASYHLFSIQNNKFIYENRFSEMYNLDKKRKEVFQRDYKLDHLFDYRYKNKNLNIEESLFLYTYDFGDNYMFVGYIEYEDPIILNNKNKIAYLLEAKGGAIFEDSKSLLLDYIEGRSISSIRREFKKWLPINFGLDNDINDFKDFDNKIDIDKENKEFTYKYRRVHKAYKGNNYYF